MPGLLMKPRPTQCLVFLRTDPPTNKLHPETYRVRKQPNSNVLLNENGFPLFKQAATGNRNANRVDSVAILQALDALVQLLDADNEVGDGVEEPVEDQGGGDQERVALALHDRLLVAEVLRGSAGVAFAARASLVLPVDVHEQEEAERHHREKRFEEVTGDGDEALAEAVEAGDREEEHHDRLRGGGVPEDNPLQRHRISVLLAFPVLVFWEISEICFAS
ncbi:hypothetical protein C1H46_041171 [Malus baccata]|uniref:Uncharacterized protein n=1 Tax=Malus baccata TaxID=106549 RepID=A0A540KGE3_MALBA|nr:hypothetical protein C1H46_041171 [Malus baccata]